MNTEPATKSKKQTAEQATLESEQRYKRLLASVTDYVYAVTVEDGRAVSTFHGPGCEAVTGYTSDEFQHDQQLWYRMIREEDRPAVLDAGGAHFKRAGDATAGASHHSQRRQCALDPEYDRAA